MDEKISATIGRKKYAKVGTVRVDTLSILIWNMQVQGWIQKKMN